MNFGSPSCEQHTYANFLTSSQGDEGSLQHIMDFVCMHRFVDGWLHMYRHDAWHNQGLNVGGIY